MKIVKIMASQSKYGKNSRGDKMKKMIVLFLISLGIFWTSGCKDTKYKHPMYSGK